MMMDPENALLVSEPIVQSLKTNVTIQIASPSTGSPASSTPVTPELDPQYPSGKTSLFNFASPALSGGVFAHSRLCAAWAILLAAHGGTADATIYLSKSAYTEGEVKFSLRWDQTVHDFVSEVEMKLETIRRRRVSDQSTDPSTTIISLTTDQAGCNRDDERFNVVLPSLLPQSTSQNVSASSFVQEGVVHLEFEHEHDGLDETYAFIASQYEYIIGQSCSSAVGDSSTLAELKPISFRELDQVWSWNAQLPQRVDGVCIHRSFMERAARHPDLPAVEAHDGRLTYRELDDLSTRLARQIIGVYGVLPKTTIIVFIEKSAWVPVAQLAVMKCGCASVVFDVALPSERHSTVARLLGASAVLTSPSCSAEWAALELTIPQLVLSTEASQSWPSSQSITLPDVVDTDTLYICFTSGSTGVPKGALISHANYASAVALQRERLDFREYDRVFDFASYAFDAAWCNLIHTLMIGGCLCIPSDEERREDLAGALRKYNVNYAVLTPSVAWFPASELPESLRTIHFGGEPLKASLVKQLSPITVINAYGPAECSTVSTAGATDPEDDDDPTIGTGLGACTWVVRQDGSDLAALGETGELWIEGPIVGQGYINEPEKTALAFVQSPSWLLRGIPGSPDRPRQLGRQGRLYRTGDLVRYSPDGRLHFVGRKDSQVKIRGQRVEIGEIEHNLQRALTDEAKADNIQIIAEVITSPSGQTPTLVSFVFIGHQHHRQRQRDEEMHIIQQALRGIEDRLTLLVPPYMIPSAYIPVVEVPMTATGKIDRKKLRHLGAQEYWHQQRTSEAEPNCDGESEAHTALRGIWSEVLNLPLDNISLDAVFQRLGGDSISAMQVASRCRARKMAVRVASIMKYQTIRRIVQSAPPKKNSNSAISDIKADDEEKPFPLTPIQQILFDNNPQGINHYTLSFVVKLGRPSTIDELSTALVAITKRHSMLRARFRKSAKTLDWEQLVAPPGSECFHLRSHVFDDLSTMQSVVDRRQATLDLVNGPVFAVDVFDKPGEAQTLLMSAHHAVMDLVSWRILWHELSQCLLSGNSSPLLPTRMSFRSWSLAQRAEAEGLDPHVVLPFEITPADFQYWGVTPDQLHFRDSILNITTLDSESTSLLLGNSNNAFGTEIQDILVGSLIFGFIQQFPDRKPPTLFVEGHGRETVDGIDDVELAEIIGWFTSLHPISIGKSTSHTILELIQLAKDTRKRIPSKGRPYFASRFFSEAGKEVFGAAHKHAEVIFNYRGSFQQLEHSNSIIQLEDRSDRNVVIHGDGPDYCRPSLIDINLVIQNGQLQTWTRYHGNMRKEESIVRWINDYPNILRKVAYELAGLPSRYTLTDFPLLDVSYDGLNTILTSNLQQLGVSEALVKDIYPCTPMQEGILISSSLERATYRTVTVWEAIADNDQLTSVQRLGEAWNTISRLHSVFATIFSTNPDTGRYVQVVLKQPNEAVFVQAPTSQLAAQYLQELPRSEKRSAQPECFFFICVGSRGDVACRLEMTHALMDALSLPIIVRHLTQAYMGQELQLESQFRDYISKISHHHRHDIHLSYWSKYLSGVLPCILPGDMDLRFSPVRPKSAGIQYGWVTVPSDVTDCVAEICQRNEITRSVFLHVVWALVLAYYTGHRDVCFGYVSSGRDLPVDGIEDIVGPLINMQIARVDVDRFLDVLLTDVNAYHIEHLDHQHVSLAEIQHEISSSKQMFNTNITVRDARISSVATGFGLSLVEVSEEDPHEYDLVLSVVLDKMHTDVRMQYRTDFSGMTNAQSIQHVLESVIRYLCNSLHRGRPSDGPKVALYEDYFSHVFHTNETSALSQWMSVLNGCDTVSHFPVIANNPASTEARSSSCYSITNLLWRHDYDIRCHIVAAWGLLAASHGDTEDVIVGTRLKHEASYLLTKSERSIPLHITVDFNALSSVYLSSVQAAIEKHSKLPDIPMQRLRRLDSHSAASSWDFPVVLTIDSESSSEGTQYQQNGGGHDSDRRTYLHFVVTKTDIQVISYFDENVFSLSQITGIFSQLETVLRQLSSPAFTSSTLSVIDTISGPDFKQICTWNSTIYDEAHVLVHDLITETARSMPDAPAISSWDGQLSYHELDVLSTRLAHYLVNIGVGPGVIVPVLSEKTLCVPIAVLGVIKTGAAGVMIDSTQPVNRLNSIFRQVNADIVLVSAQTASTGQRCDKLRLITVDRAFVDRLSSPEPGASLPRLVQPSDLLYVSFTSGSTGEPKGAMITHTCFSSSIKYQQAALGFRTGRRVYDFASYSFDAAWSNLLHSLTSGGCLCIPAEEARRNDLSRSIRDSKASLLNITPSVLRHLNASDLPDIEQVLMGGEAWVEADFLDWIDRTRLINSYGPGECTIKSCLIRAYRGMVPNTLGYGIGLNTWIVRTDGSDRLAPIGSVGELWLEGPQVGIGYIGDEARTAASFITRPKWQQGVLRKPTWAPTDGSQCRFYRTGDLVSYAADGTLIFHSRKDSQVKIRGQRTELGEIERGIQTALIHADLKAQLVVDVFKPLRGENTIIVAFLLPEQAMDLQQKLQSVDDQLSDMVPSYMIPTAYIILTEFPMTTTGKIHRKALRETYSAMSQEEITALNALRSSHHTPPSTSTEKLLQRLWGEVLNIDTTTIYADSNFLRVGGDSLGAMRLVGVARKNGLALTVADIFQHPQLHALAGMVERASEGASLSLGPSVIAPFSLLELSRKVQQENVKQQAAEICGLDSCFVEDVFPCTPLQTGLLAETAKNTGMYVLTETWRFRQGIQHDRFRCAWRNVICQNPILRTRIVDLPQLGLVQVVVDSKWYQRDDVITLVEAAEFGLGTPLMVYEISDLSFRWSIHHALYDGWTSPLIFESLAKFYREETSSAAPVPFQAFLRYLKDSSTVEAENYWRTQFKGFQAQNFPSIPAANYMPRCDESLFREIHNSSHSNDGFTTATKVRLAWAILLATVTNSPDASFGATVSGRQANVSGIESMMGPTIATVPLRVSVDRTRTIRSLLESVQSQSVSMVPFEQTGLPSIRRLNEDCKMACAFQSLLVVQPQSQHESESFLFESSFIEPGTDHGDAFNQYAICLVADLLPQSLRLRVSYDSAVISCTQISRLVDRFENIYGQISCETNGSSLVSQLNTGSPSDLDQILIWNKTMIERCDEPVHKIIERVACRQPEAPAICSWDGDFTYEQLDKMSTQLARHLLQSDHFGESTKCIVPLYFEKSKWTPVCQLAIMKIGSTSTLLDAELPRRRLEVVIDLVKPQLILCSVEQEAKARELAPTARVLVVGNAGAWELTTDDSSPPSLPQVHPDTQLYINFTSGSTGVPKGAIVTHANYASAIKHVSRGLRCYTPQTRTYDHTAYAFDATWQNLLLTLGAGGCLCIPSQHEIHNEPVEAVMRRRANYMLMIPSVSKVLHGAKLDLVNFGGEKASLGEINYWIRQGSEVILTYGPSECTPTTTVHPIDPENPRAIIGKGVGVRTWIVEETGSKLAAIGDIGELWLEGPVVGGGYLNNPTQTATSFVDEPTWMEKLPGPFHRAYRTGDLVRYEEDGSIEYIGRKDAQIKIRGQRVQLEEIEHHLFNVVKDAGVSQVVNDILRPRDSAEPTLVAFILPSGSSRLRSGTRGAIEFAQKVARTSRRGLAASVPSYMIPNGFMVVDEIPKTGSGKVDRNKLRAVAAAMHKEDILQVDSIGNRPPETPAEIKLHSLVTQVLSWDGEPFGMDNDFIQLGGDSISAMRLVAQARNEGMQLRVADILSKDSLSEIIVSKPSSHAKSNTVTAAQESSVRVIDSASVDTFARNTILRQVEPGHGELVRVLPVTEMQRIYLLDNLFIPRRSWFYSYVDFSHGQVDVSRLAQSCERLVQLCDIYRTAFVRMGETFVQAVLASWKPTICELVDLDDIERVFDEMVEGELDSPVRLGAPLIKFSVLVGKDGTAKLVIGMSHAIYDGLSRSRMVQLLADLYNGATPPHVPSFHGFIIHNQSIKESSCSFWRKALHGSQMTVLPMKPSTAAPPQDEPPILMQSSVSLPKQPRGITQASIFTLACATALNHLTGNPDIVMGRVVSGRASVTPDLASVVGPCLNRSPVRVSFSESQTKASRLRDLQNRATEAIDHETLGLSDIVKQCTDWDRGTTDFGVLIQYQNIDETPMLAIDGAVGSLRSKELWYIPVASTFLEILATPDNRGQAIIKIIAGSAFERETLSELLKGICAELVDLDQQNLTLQTMHPATFYINSPPSSIYRSPRLPVSVFTRSNTVSQSMALVVHHLQVSQSERIVWLAEELGLDYNLVIHKRDPFLSPQSIRDLNPLGQAPVIQDTVGDRPTITLAESGAIAEYILSKYDADGNLRLPPSHPDYAKYLYWFHFANGNLHPQLSRVMVLKLCDIDVDPSSPSAPWHAKRHVNHQAKFLRFMDDHLAAGNKWLAGDQFTVADIMNVFPLTTMRTFSGLDLSEYPNILAYLGRCAERDGYKRARAKGDPELEVMISGPPPPQFLQRLRDEGKM
ncbi:acetyl-CoA synthetase-like protein [Xylariaceae sp. FL1272]|nr:acetyl-CoA synthetase-like protein [Xylariaceae sp. FL1272]